MTYKTAKTQHWRPFSVGNSRTVQTAHTIPKLPTLNRVNTYKISVDNCKAIPYINITGRDIAPASTKRK